jgi:hypothetical protein
MVQCTNETMSCRQVLVTWVRKHNIRKTTLEDSLKRIIAKAQNQSYRDRPQRGCSNNSLGEENSCGRFEISVQVFEKKKLARKMIRLRLKYAQVHGCWREIEITLSCRWIVTSCRWARIVSLVRISMGHHYISNKCKVIYHIHTTCIKVSYYIDYSITT